MGTNCLGGTDSLLASRFRQNNESPQNISAYKSNNFFVIFYLIFFPQTDLLSLKRSMIMLSTFYFVHHVSKSCRAVIYITDLAT